MFRRILRTHENDNVIAGFDPQARRGCLLRLNDTATNVKFSAWEDRSILALEEIPGLILAGSAVVVPDKPSSIQKGELLIYTSHELTVKSRQSFP